MDAGIRFILILIGALLLIAIIWDVVKKRENQSKRKDEAKDINSTRLSPSIGIQDEPKIQEPSIEISNIEEPSLSFNAGADQNQATSTLIEDEDSDVIVTRVSNVPPASAATSKQNSSVSNFKKSESKPQTQEAPKPKAPLRSISISIVSLDKGGFNGAKLLEALQAVYMFHGKMNIFHRYKFNDGTGNLLFSMASLVEPGNFDLSTIKSKFFPGVTLFYAIEQVAEPEESLDAMLKYAKQLAYRLNGQLLDQYHKPLTIHQIEDYKDNLKRVVNA